MKFFRVDERLGADAFSQDTVRLIGRNADHADFRIESPSGAVTVFRIATSDVILPELTEDDVATAR